MVSPLNLSGPLRLGWGLAQAQGRVKGPESAKVSRGSTTYWGQPTLGPVREIAEGAHKKPSGILGFDLNPPLSSRLGNRSLGDPGGGALELEPGRAA